MLLWPWKKPRWAETMQMSSTHGASAAIAAHEFSFVVTMTDSGLQNTSITSVPITPMVRKTFMETE